MGMNPKESEDHANSGKSKNEKSEEYFNFEEAMRRIMTQNPEEAKRIREKPIPPDPEEKPNK